MIGCAHADGQVILVKRLGRLIGGTLNELLDDMQIMFAVLWRGQSNHFPTKPLFATNGFARSRQWQPGFA